MKRWKGDGSKRNRKPITTSILARIQPLLSTSIAYDRMMWAAYILGTYGLLRLGEFARTAGKDDRVLCWRHISWFTVAGERIPLVEGKVGERAVEYQVLLEASKTDPFRCGVTIRVLAPTAVKTMKAHCNGLVSAPLFNNPVFEMPRGASKEKQVKPLDRETVVQSVRAHLNKIGERMEEYNGHSFRKGGAQSLAEANVAADTIQAMGRWTSDCYKLYITTPPQAITSAALALEPGA